MIVGYIQRHPLLLTQAGLMNWQRTEPINFFYYYDHNLDWSYWSEEFEYIEMEHLVFPLAISH